MNIKIFARIGIILGSTLVGLFLIFLLLPFVLNFFIDKYTPQIVGEINKLTGLSAGLEDVKIVTTPKLTAGLSFKKFELFTPEKEHVFSANDFDVKMSLLPILAKDIRIDVIRLGNAEINLKFDKDGNLDLLRFLPETEQKEESQIAENAVSYLPFGLKLSNHLPDIHVGQYKVVFTDGKDNYTLSGNSTDITNFVFNKSIKIKTDGKVVLKGREQFNYNLNLFNKIMPDIELNELVFNPPEAEKKEQEEYKVDIISILKGLYDYKLTANATVDLKTTPDSIDGNVNVSKLSIIELPDSDINLLFKGQTIDLKSNIYTAKNEISNLSGKVTTGKKPYLDLNFKSDLNISNVLNITKKIALIFNIKDLQTLTASGSLNSNFNIKSDLKTVSSSGYLKIPTAKLYYGLYKVGLDNINANILLDNNNINLQNISFSVLGQPLKIYGKISSDAVADIHISANQLNIKGLLVALGQASLFKENPIYSGTLTMDALIKGKLDKINPVIKLNIANLDLKNIPSDIRVKIPQIAANITSDGTENFSGTSDIKNIKLINPALTVQIPQINAKINQDEITIPQTPVYIEKNKATVSGKIINYLKDKILLDFVSSGDIKSALKGDMNLNKGTLNLSYYTTDLSTIIIPLFDKSKMSFNGKINITGDMTNPILSGNIDVPSLNIPEIPVIMQNLAIKLNGTILHGSATVKDFASGGIKAENISTDFVLKGMAFYLNNLKGTSFDGKINGNIVYNLSNAKTKVEFNGSGMNAEKAIEGAAGIKKALTGTLGFKTNLTLTVLDYNDMIKSMKGNLSFDVKNGAFGTIGRFENFLNAANIVNNVLLKNTVAAITSATGLATTGEFDSITGSMTFSNGWANLSSIKSAGKSLCYYVTGKFNILNCTTNVIILGRLDAPMVAKLGVLGDLSATKLISYIPGFGAATAKYLQLMTSNPKEEKVSEIPMLTNGSNNYKDFKVQFNGGIESKSSVKSFKWLTNPDMTELEQKSLKDSVKDIKSGFNTDVKTHVDNINKTVETGKQNIEDTKKQINDAKEQLRNTAEEYKNLFKSLKSIPQQQTVPVENAESVKTETTQTDSAATQTEE